MTADNTAPASRATDPAPASRATESQSRGAAAPRPDRVFSLRRMGGLVLRHWYLLRGSVPRLLEMTYWPTVQIIMWGFLTQFLDQQSHWVAQSFGVFVGAVLLWDVVFRSNLGFSLSFMEEMWARNLGHLFVSPLRPYELVLALTFVSLMRTLVGIVPATFIAIGMWGFNIYDLGLPLLAFFFNLLALGWVIAMAVCALVLRFGLGAESLAWSTVFAIWPFSCVFYPVAVLPDWLQPVALALPSAHVFEGMRQVLFEGTFSAGHFWAAMGLNGLYLSMAMGFFLYMFRVARRRGQLLSIGE